MITYRPFFGNEFIEQVTAIYQAEGWNLYTDTAQVIFESRRSTDRSACHGEAATRLTVSGNRRHRLMRSQVDG